MGDEVFYHVCHECVSKKGGCCKGNSVPYTMNDINRIAALGHNPADFLIAGEYGRSFIEGFEPWWVESFVPRGNYWYKLNTRARQDGSCVFLVDGKGCTLGENRPSICRMYPFYINEKNGEVCYEPGEAECCDIPGKKYDVNEALSLVGETPASVLAYYTDVKEDCIRNRAFHEKLIDQLLGSTPA